jgi:GDPmannose 4,6-dehydratase
MKRALITGITGQDGSYLAELLLSKGYEVHGIIRRSSSFNTPRLNHLFLFKGAPERDPRLHLHYGDLADGSIIRLLEKTQPDEVYNLGAQSHVRVSFDIPEYTGDITGMGTLRLLDALRQSGIKTRFYQASSSEMFGLAPAPQSEATAFYPRSPYACAKVFSYWITKNYRESYGMFAVNGILFNHESPRRGGTFVSKKITDGIGRIMAGLTDALYLGNLSAIRDWGYAAEYVEVMWRMLQQDTPDDFVIGTGEGFTVQQFVEEAFQLAGLDWREYVKFDERYCRPAEVPALIADPSKARRVLGWEPRVRFRSLVQLMLDASFKDYGLKLNAPGELPAEATRFESHGVIAAAAGGGPWS